MGLMDARGAKPRLGGLARRLRLELGSAIAREDKREVRGLTLELFRLGALDERTLLAVIDVFARPLKPRTRAALWRSQLLAAEVLILERKTGKREAAIAEVMKKRKVSRRRIFEALRDTEVQR